MESRHELIWIMRRTDWRSFDCLARWRRCVLIMWGLLWKTRVLNFLLINFLLILHWGNFYRAFRPMKITFDNWLFRYFYHLKINIVFFDLVRHSIFLFTQFIPFQFRRKLLHMKHLILVHDSFNFERKIQLARKWRLCLSVDFTLFIQR